MEKTEWASDTLVFLGILLDGRFLIISIPKDKRDAALQLLKIMVDKKKATVKELQQLCGFLNFLGKAIFPGRTFTRWMYSKYSKVVNIKGSDNPLMANDFKLKQHHHVKLDSEFKLDCQIWIEFLESSDTAICRQMVDVNDNNLKLYSTDIGFFSDEAQPKHWASEQYSEINGLEVIGQVNSSKTATRA